jgi:RNA polymerase sigma factor (sigma-70 family)
VRSASAWAGTAVSARGLGWRAPKGREDGAPLAASRAFDDIYRREFGPVWRYLALMLRNPADAEEATQETFIRAFGAYQEGHGPDGPWLPWLLVVARHLAISRHRRARLVQWSPWVTVEEAQLSEPGTFEGTEVAIWLDQVTRLLPPRQREALFLRYLGDLDDHGVAAVMGVTPSGARSLIGRAVASLRTHAEVGR